MQFGHGASSSQPQSDVPTHVEGNFTEQSTFNPYIIENMYCDFPPDYATAVSGNNNAGGVVQNFTQNGNGRDVNELPTSAPREIARQPQQRNHVASGGLQTSTEQQNAQTPQIPGVHTVAPHSQMHVGGRWQFDGSENWPIPSSNLPNLDYTLDYTRALQDSSKSNDIPRGQNTAYNLGPSGIPTTHSNQNIPPASLQQGNNSLLFSDGASIPTLGLFSGGLGVRGISCDIPSQQRNDPIVNDINFSVPNPNYQNITHASVHQVNASQAIQNAGIPVPDSNVQNVLPMPTADPGDSSFSQFADNTDLSTLSNANLQDLSQVYSQEVFFNLNFGDEVPSVENHDLQNAPHIFEVAQGGWMDPNIQPENFPNSNEQQSVPSNTPVQDQLEELDTAKYDTDEYDSDDLSDLPSELIEDDDDYSNLFSEINEDDLDDCSDLPSEPQYDLTVNCEPNAANTNMGSTVAQAPGSYVNEMYDPDLQSTDESVYDDGSQWTQEQLDTQMSAIHALNRQMPQQYNGAHSQMQPQLTFQMSQDANEQAIYGSGSLTQQLKTQNPTTYPRNQTQMPSLYNVGQVQGQGMGMPFVTTHASQTVTPDFQQEPWIPEAAKCIERVYGFRIRPEDYELLNLGYNPMSKRTNSTNANSYGQQPSTTQALFVQGSSRNGGTHQKNSNSRKRRREGDDGAGPASRPTRRRKKEHLDRALPSLDQLPKPGSSSTSPNQPITEYDTSFYDAGDPEEVFFIPQADDEGFTCRYLQPETGKPCAAFLNSPLKRVRYRHLATHAQYEEGLIATGHLQPADAVILRRLGKLVVHCEVEGCGWSREVWRTDSVREEHEQDSHPDLYIQRLAKREEQKKKRKGSRSLPNSQRRRGMSS